LNVPVSVAHARKEGLVWAVLTTLFTRVGALILALIAAIVVTRGLGPTGRGELQIIQNAANVAQIGLGLGLGKATVYFMAGSRRNEFMPVFMGQFVVSCVAIALVLTLVAQLPIAAVAPLRSPFATGLAILLATAALAETFGSSVLRGLQQFGRANSSTIISSLIRCAALGALVLGGMLSVLTAGLIRTVTTAWLGITGMRHARRTGIPLRPRMDMPLWRESLGYAGLSFTYSIFQNLHYTADVFLIQQWRSTAEVGIYTAGTSLIQLLWYLPNAVGTVLLPSTVGDSNYSKAREVARTSRIVFAIMTMAAVGLVVAAPLIVTLMFGDGFSESAHVVRLLAPGVAASALHQIGAVYLAAQGAFRPLTIVASLGLAINMAANVYVIPRWGIAGAAVVSSFSYSLSALVSTLLFCRTVGLPAASALLLTREDLRHVLAMVRRRMGRAG
jgi:O-antigen/teichoic acid export membrane protein